MHSTPMISKLTDVEATPAGWSPIAFQTAQISVPFAENAGSIECGSHDIGRVFIDETAESLDGQQCGFAKNDMTIKPAGSSAIRHESPATVNGVLVELGSTRAAGRTTYLERGLGEDITATGLDAKAVLRTLTRSPLSVVLDGRHVSSPKSWRTVRFGGVGFRVPRTWSQRTDPDIETCGDEVQTNRLNLDRALKFIESLCPVSIDDAESQAGPSGMTVTAGPAITHVEPMPPTNCRMHNGLRICFQSPLLHGELSQEFNLGVLVAFVYFQPNARPIEIEMGLNGSGPTAARIYDSVRPVR